MCIYVKKKRIANDTTFGLTMQELEKIMIPENFVGRAPQQTQEYIENFVKPMLKENKQLLQEKGEAVRV